MGYKKIDDIEKYKKIGLNIAYYRKKKMTQSELAEKINISRTYMSNIEAPNMETHMSLNVLFKIADTLEVPLECLVNMD